MRPHKPRLRAFLLVVLVVTGGLPLVAGTHVNDLLVPPWKQVPDEPTGNALLDAAIHTASGVLDQVDQRIKPLREEPQFPATFFHDIFDPSDRVGGWGNWSESMGGGNWHLSHDAAGTQVQSSGLPSAGAGGAVMREGIERGYRFGGSSGYPEPPLVGAFQLVSPLISLRSLPVDESTDVTGLVAQDAPEPTVPTCDDVRDQLPGGAPQNVWNNVVCGNGVWPEDSPNPGAMANAALNATHAALGNRLTAPHRILLAIDHRFNLACVDPDMDGICDGIGGDGFNNFDGAAVGVLPEGENAPTFLMPLRGTQNYDPASMSFAGQQLSFTEDVFDLSRWAGRDVRLVFQVGAVGDPGSQARPTLLDQGCDPFCGWDISNLRIEGPAYPSNVRLDRVIYPLSNPDGGPGFVARPGDTPFQVLLLNRGQVTETVDVRMRAEWGAGSAECVVHIDSLRPGDAVPVEFSTEAGEDDCSQLYVEDAEDYTVTLEAALRDRRDHYPLDNTRQMTVRGDGPDIRLQMLRANTLVLAPDGRARIDATLWNNAITDGEVDVHLRIDYRNATATSFEEGVQGNNSLVVFEEGVAPVQRVQVPQRTQLDATWGFRLQEVGCYRLRVHATDPVTGDERGTPQVVAVGVKMQPDQALDCGSDYDLRLVGARIDTDYNWTSLGFGPATEATARLTIQNNGFFAVDQAMIHLVVQNEKVEDGGDASNTWHHSVRLDAGFSLGQGEQTEVRIPFQLPPEDGRYRFVFGVDLLGDLIPGLPLEDRDPSNDCRRLGLDPASGTQITQSVVRSPQTPCPVGGLDGVLVQSRPDLQVDVAVVPEAGRTGEAFPRDLRLHINNTGNVVVEGALLTLLVQRAGGSPHPPSEWIIETSPLPGRAQSWESLSLLNPEDPTLPKVAESRLTLIEEGMYFVTAFLDLDGDGTEEVFRQVRLDAFDTIYSDTFESGGVDMDFPDIVAGSGVVPRNASWQRVRGEVPDSHGGTRDVAMWRFGDAKTGQYPNDADAVLELPPVDLSAARRAVLALAHSYSLEQGYDGARLEASLDGGTTWLPLEPAGGYPGAVAADSPLNPQRDPTVATPAFTGDSQQRDADRWITDQFDLATLPGFTTPIQLVRFSQGGFGTGPHTGDIPTDRRVEDGRITTHPSWALPQRDCSKLPLEDCWYRENANWWNPLPLCDPQAHPDRRLPPSLADLCAGRDPDLHHDSHHYWWSGSARDVELVDCCTNPGASLSLEFTIDPDDIQAGDQARIVFWYWKDASGTLFAGELPDEYACYRSQGGDNGRPCDAPGQQWRYRQDPSIRFGASTPSGTWSRGEFRIADAHQRGGEVVEIDFRYVDAITRYNQGNRGAALDGVRLEVFDPATGVVRSSQPLLDPSQAPPETAYISGTLNAAMASVAGCSTTPGSAAGCAFASGWGELWDRSNCTSPSPSGAFGGNCHRLEGWTLRDQTDFCNQWQGLCRMGADGAVEVDLGWSRVAKAGVTNARPCDAQVQCEAWGVRQVETRRTELAPVWQFGATTAKADESPVFTYPTNAHQRLVTPRVDLAGVAGEFANLTFWELYDLMPGDRRNVLVQVVEPTPEGGERVRDWQPLGYASPGRMTQSNAQGGACTDGEPAWCPVQLDISPFIGQKVRFAFEIQTTHRAESVEDKEIGWTWLIDEVGVEAASMTGEPARLRLRAATDGSIGGGQWSVQNLQLVGILYEENLAAVPDEPVRDRRLASGETLTLNGTVRNLGSMLQSNLFLDLSAVAVNNDEAPPAAVAFQRDRTGAKIDPEEGPVGPISLNSAGATNLAGQRTDRVPYSAVVTLPQDAPPGTIYQFTLRLVDGSGTVLVDENLGDHERVFHVEIQEEGDVPLSESGSLLVHPPTVALGEAAQFTLALQNTGPKSLVGSLHVTATRLDDEAPSVAVRDDLQFTVRPDAEGRLEWDWQPQEAGFYRVTATADPEGLGSTPFHTHLLVGAKPMYYEENFSADPFDAGGWERDPEPCNGLGCWRRSGVFQEHGDGSLFVGNDAGFIYPAANTRARTPWQDLAFLGKQQGEGEHDILVGASPFSPHLSLKYMPMLDEGHSIQVMADRDDDAPGYRSLLTRDTHTQRTGGQGLTGQDDVNWHVASFPLYGNGDNNVLGTSVALLGNHNVSFQFQANHGAGLARGFAVDLVTISSYNVEVDPPRHNISLRPGADKTFYFRVQNTGAATDTYQIRLREDANNLLMEPSLATVEVPQPALTLAPGESALAPVRVAIPFERYENDFFSGSDLVLEVISSEDPNRVARGTLSVERFIGDKLPDLVTDLRRPAGEVGPVGEAEQVNFVVSITNDGSGPSRETDVILFACPKKYTDAETREERKVSSIGECGQRRLGKTLAEMRLPPLLPSQDMEEGQADNVWTTTVSWIPKVLEDRGDYWIVAVADPLGKVPQFSRDTSTRSLDLTIAPFEQPDLRVTELHVTDGRGDPVTSAFAGDVLYIEGTVRNDGDATAPSVRVRILNQFALRDERIGDLHPGGSHTLAAQWIAQPGNWVVLFESSTGVVETSTDNNAKSWSLAIRSGALEAEWEPALMHLDPGQGMEGLLRLHNQRDQAVDLLIPATTAEVSIHGLPSSIHIPRGASREIPVEVRASPFAEHGAHAVRVDLVQRESGNALASSTLEVHVGAQRDLRLVPEPLFTPPGTAHLPLVFANDGTAPESFTVRLEAPEGWTATVLSPTLRLDAGSQRMVQGILEIPPGTPAGQYPITVEAWETLSTTLSVNVVQQPVWRSQVTEVQRLGGPLEVLVRVENAGNAPAVPPFVLGGAREAYSVQPAPSPHEPAEARSYRVTIAPGASFLMLPGQDKPVPLQASEQPPAVEAVRLDVESTGAVASGMAFDLRFGLRSVGSEAQQALPVRLWVDGVLVEEQRIDLAAGEARNVDFRWEPGKQGPRVVTATVGSSDASVARTLLLDVAPEPRGFAIPAAPSVLAVALLAAIACRRRDP